MYAYIATDSFLLSWGSYHWDRFAIYSLLLSWGSHCWGRLLVTAYFLAGGPVAGTGLLFTALLSCGSQLGQGLVMHPLAGSLLASMCVCVCVGDGWAHPQTFQNAFLDSRFLGVGGGVKSIFFLGVENGFEKLVLNGFLSH